MFYIDGGDGAGNGGGEGDQNPNGDAAPADDTKPPDTTAKGDKPADDAKPPTQLDKAQLEEFAKFLDEHRREKDITLAVSEIQKVHPKFDRAVIKARLQEIHKKDPNEAAFYNNPIGWKKLWEQIEKENRPDYEFEPVHSTTSPDDRKKLIAAAASGDYAARIQLARDRQ